MSRIGKKPIAVPSGANYKLSGPTITVEGPKGKLGYDLPEGITIAEADGGQLQVTRRSDNKRHRALHGLARSLVANMFEGVINGFTKKLEIVGVGYNAKLEGKTLVITVGFSHPVNFEIPSGLTVETPTQSTIVITGADKQLVGEFAAEVRHTRPPEPYGGKGIKYDDEVVRRKAGKALGGGA